MLPRTRFNAGAIRARTKRGLLEREAAREVEVAEKEGRVYNTLEEILRFGGKIKSAAPPPPKIRMRSQKVLSLPDTSGLSTYGARRAAVSAFSEDMGKRMVYVGQDKEAGDTGETGDSEEEEEWRAEALKVDLPGTKGAVFPESKRGSLQEVLFENPDLLQDAMEAAGFRFTLPPDGFRPREGDGIDAWVGGSMAEALVTQSGWGAKVRAGPKSWKKVFDFMKSLAEEEASKRLEAARKARRRRTHRKKGYRRVREVARRAAAVMSAEWDRGEGGGEVDEEDLVSRERVMKRRNLPSHFAAPR